jgi:hypothetical protein
MTPSEKFLEEVIEVFNKGNPILNIPINNAKGNFKKLLKDKLNEYESFFKEKIVPLTKEKAITFDGISITNILDNIKNLNDGLLSVIDKYLNGKPYEANKVFHETLEIVKTEKVQLKSGIPIGNLFFRARPSTEEHYKKEQLFHIPFQKRTIVSTNRYSISGTPALYLADNSYTCWEEFNRTKFKDLYFSVFENEDLLDIVQIFRLDDLLKDLENNTPKKFIPFKILQFFMYFPLTISCTIKVYDKEGSFKPEYIIPQMLLEYVVKDKKIDGIMFPSTKINYDNLKNLKSYKESGYCPVLKKKFKLSKPSSLELEELLDNPVSRETQMGGGIQPDETLSKISVIEGEERYYFNTSFGKIDKLLSNKNRERL